MLNFPPPPPPSIDMSQLENLADYYRSLVEYYRRASEIAAQQLAHVEALLHPNEILAFRSESELKGWLENSELIKPNSSQSLIQGSPASQLSEIHDRYPNEEDNKSSQFDVSNQKTSEEEDDDDEPDEILFDFLPIRDNA